MLAQGRAEQRGLPRPVASDEPHHAGSVQRAAESLHQGARADRHAHVPCGHDLITAPFRHLEPQGHRVVRSDDRAEPRQPLETLAPALGLFAVLSSDVARDVVLLVRDGALLLLERTLLRQPALGALGDKVGVAGRVRRGGAAFEVQHVIHGGGQKRAVMAHEQHGALTGGEVLLEPLRRLEIQVIRRLGELAGGRFPNRRRGAVVAVLLEQRHAEAGRARDAPATGLEIARQQPEQSRLPGAVAAYDAPALPGRDREGEVGEQVRSAEVHADADECDLGHGGLLPGSQSQDLTACKQEGPGAVNLRLLWSRVAWCISHALNVAELAAWPYGPNQCRPSASYRALVFAPKQTLIHAPRKRVREETRPAGLRVRPAVWIK